MLRQAMDSCTCPPSRFRFLHSPPPTDCSRVSIAFVGQLVGGSAKQRKVRRGVVISSVAARLPRLGDRRLGRPQLRSLRRDSAPCSWLWQFPTRVARLAEQGAGRADAPRACSMPGLGRHRWRNRRFGILLDSRPEQARACHALQPTRRPAHPGPRLRGRSPSFPYGPQALIAPAASPRLERRGACRWRVCCFWPPARRKRCAPGLEAWKPSWAGSAPERVVAGGGRPEGALHRLSRYDRRIRSLPSP